MAQVNKHYVTPSARICFPALFEPKSFDESTPGKFGCLLVFPKDTDLSGLKALIKEAYSAEFAAGTPNVTNPLRDGNTKADEWGVAFKDATFVRLSTKIKPPVYDQNGTQITDPEQIYSGCAVRAEIHAAAYNKLGNKGISLYLDGIQKLGDLPRIGVDHNVATQRAFINTPAGALPSVSPEEQKAAPMPSAEAPATDKSNDDWL